MDLATVDGPDLRRFDGYDANRVAAALEEQLAAEGKLWRQDPQGLREVMAEGAERAEIPHLTPHTPRHTHGTRWLQIGGDIYKALEKSRSRQRSRD